MPTYVISKGGAVDTPDASINSENPDTNYGDPVVPEWRVAWNGTTGSVWRAIIEFDISEILSFETVVSAELKVYSLYFTALSGDAIVYRLTEPNWTEMGCTWNTYDGAYEWETAYGGGDFTTDDPVGVPFTFPSGDGYQTITDLETLVQDACTNRSGRLILIIKGANESEAGSNGIVWAPSEHPNGTLHPELTIVTEFTTGTTTYVQTGTTAILGVVEACSGLDVPASADAVQAVVNGIPGIYETTITITKNTAGEVAIGFEITFPFASEIPAGPWGIRWETGSTVDGGGSLKWGFTYICRINSAGSSFPGYTIASATNQDITLTANTIYEIGLDGIEMVHDSGDRVYIVIGVRNVDPLNNLDMTVLPELSIETPIIENLSDTGFQRPTTTGSPKFDWTNHSALTASDASRAQTATPGHLVDTATYEFDSIIPAGATVYGFQIQLEGKCSGTIGIDEAETEVRLSWDGGATYSSALTQGWLAADPSSLVEDDVKISGSPGGGLGRASWTQAEVNDTNFRCQIEFSADIGGDFSGRPYGMDAVLVKVYYVEAVVSIRRIILIT